MALSNHYNRGQNPSTIGAPHYVPVRQLQPAAHVLAATLEKPEITEICLQQADKQGFRIDQLYVPGDATYYLVPSPKFVARQYVVLPPLHDNGIWRCSDSSTPEVWINLVKRHLGIPVPPKRIRRVWEY